MVQKLSEKSKLEKPSKKKYVFNKFVDFCKRTDLHGFKYIVMEDLTLFERCCWAVAVLISIVIAIFFVITAYRWYARNPVVTVIESTQGAIWDIPFPAVTLCNVNSVSRKAAEAFSKNLTLPGNITSEYVFKVLKYIPLLFHVTPSTKGHKKHLRVLQDILELNEISIEALFRELAPAISCDKMLQRCMWKNIMYRCEQLFAHVTTKLGLCCTFNYFAVNTSVADKNTELIQLSSPRRVSSCGYQTGLTVLLKLDIDDYYSTATASHGILALIDNAYNIPDLDSPVRLVNPTTEILIGVSPERTYSTKGVKSFTPEQRNCFYQDEATIAEFNKYSFQNCMVYQKILAIENECDCVPVFFPIKGGYRACNFRDLDCMDHIGEQFSTKGHVKVPESLRCLPECEHYDYPLEVAMGQLSTNVPLNGLPFFENVNMENSSVLNVFFNDLVSTRYRRDVYLNWQNILAAFGGLLSLMLGFTLISGFDFVLFFVFSILYDCTIGNIVERMKWNKQKNDVIKVGERGVKIYNTERSKDWRRNRY